MNAMFRIPPNGYKEHTSVTLAQIVASDRVHVAAPVRQFLRVYEGSQSAFGSRFRRLVDLWLKATLNMSSIEEMVLHPAYQAIIGMGPPVIPMLLDELEREPNHWFAALYAVTGGENPVTTEDEGDLDRMAEAWLTWARAKSYR